MNVTRNIKQIGLVLVVILTCLVGLFSSASVANADITQPEEYYGDITINGLAAPVGTAIVAKIGGVERGSLVTTEAGKYGGPDTFDTRLVVAGEEADIGETITFWVNGVQANQTSVYQPGESKELDLTAQAHPLATGDIQITRALDYLRQAQQADGSIGGFVTSAWAVMAIAAAGEDPNQWTAGGNSVVAYLRNNANHLDSNKATDWERSILAIAAAGENPRDFGGVDYVDTLRDFYDGTQIGNDSQLNDDFWGILALAAVDEGQAIVQNSRTFIVNNQNGDGGWGWTVGGNSDADNTAAAVSALVAAGESLGSPTIANALTYLKSQQQNNGGFVSEGVTNSGVNSWVINAITDVGQSSVGEEWRQSGNNPVGYLLSLQDADGAIRWSVTQRVNPEWMTAYAIPALLGKSWLRGIPPPAGGEDEDGVGGSGGGGVGYTYLIEYTLGDGTFTTDATARTPDGRARITIPKGTRALNQYGGAVTFIIMRQMEDGDRPPAPDDASIIGRVYMFGGLHEVTFDPPVTLTFVYPDSLVPEDVNEEDLVIAYWNAGAGEWDVLEDCVVDPEANTITVPLSHFSAFTILAYTNPAAFTASDLSISPAEVDAGESVTISVLVTNTGDLSGSYEVTLKVDDVAVDSEEVSLAGGAEEEVTFTTAKDTAGTYTVSVDNLSSTFEVRAPAATFNVSNLSISPAEVDAGESVTISVLVTNTGDLSGSYEVTLKVDDVAVGSEEVSLAGGAEEEVTFTTAKDAAGTYTVSVEGLSGTFEVRTPPELQVRSPEEGGINWPILGGVIAGVILVGLLILRLVRRSGY